MKKNIVLLLIASVFIYIVQLFIFRDPGTTGFYLLQDLAFLPISIVVVTIVVGEYIGRKEKKDRQEKTQMLGSVFFTEMGNELLQIILPLCLETNELRELFESSEISDYKSFDKLREKLKKISCKVKLNREAYEQIDKIVNERRDVLLMISSNPLLLDHADFTKMIWGLFHLIDEFRLRGKYKDLSKVDIAHLENDFSDLLRFLLINWTRNRIYTKEHFPNYYGASVGRLFECTNQHILK